MYGMYYTNGSFSIGADNPHTGAGSLIKLV